MDYEKKMTQEEKAKAYDEALEKARKRVSLEPQDHTDAILKDIFPELRESEDERVRKAIVSLVHENSYSYKSFAGVELCDMLSYLEKQKEQKPRKFKLGDKVHWHDDDKNVITITGFRDDAYLTDSAYGPILFCDEDNWERVEQKPAEWSEEDEKMRISIIFQLAGCMGNEDKIDWFKSLRPSWKPSEEQMDALRRTIYACENERSYQDDELRSLLNDLEKL